uniref:Uncharacterized protein n=1 Tax=Anopheles farauti TaxID=69004 RepID=A0A182Q515_9DIPT
MKSFAPKTKRDTVVAPTTAATRPATNALSKAPASKSGSNTQQRKSQNAPRPAAAKQNRDQASKTPAAADKAPAAVSQQTPNPAKKV